MKKAFKIRIERAGGRRILGEWSTMEWMLLMPVVLNSMSKIYSDLLRLFFRFLEFDPESKTV
jgi:hypothetical protein